MDKESASSSQTPEMLNKQDGWELKGNSEGKAVSSSIKEKELPRYLRASVGSCHDLCKYGRKHTFEEKPWRPKVKKTVKKIPGDKKNQVTDYGCEIIKREVMKSSGGVSAGLKLEAMIESPFHESPVKQRDSMQMKMKKIFSSKVKSSPVLDSQVSGNADGRKPKVLMKSYSARATSKTKEATPMLKPLLGKPGKEKDNGVKLNKTGDSKVAQKKVYVTPRCSNSSKLLGKLGGNTNLRKSQSLKGTSSRSNQKPRDVQRPHESKQLHAYSVEEKTLHVVEPEIESNVSKHDQNEHCVVEISPPSMSSSIHKNRDQEDDDEFSIPEEEEYEYSSVSNESENAEEEDGISGGNKGPRARNESLSPDSAQKLHFRKGKAVNAKTEDDNPPRKLKFKRGNTLDENKSEPDQGRRSFKQRDDNVPEEDDDLNGEKVVLRHQDVQDKKDAQGLFNNVIEETASELVKARKSKVKALVGAFETVISLQESKPSANSTT